MMKTTYTLSPFCCPPLDGLHRAEIGQAKERLRSDHLGNRVYPIISYPAWTGYVLSYIM